MHNKLIILIVTSMLLALWSCQLDTNVSSDQSGKPEVTNGALDVTRATTKTVTDIKHVQYYDYDGDGYDIPKHVYIASTSNYDDGRYKGTLNLVNYYIESSTWVYSSIYLYTVGIEYSGTVTSYANTKYVTASTTSTYYTYNGEDVNSKIYPSQTYYYNQGGFYGTLNLINYYIVSQRYVYGSICEYTVQFNYGGNVTN